MKIFQFLYIVFILSTYLYPQNEVDNVIPVSEELMKLEKYRTMLLTKFLNAEYFKIETEKTVDSISLGEKVIIDSTVGLLFTDTINEAVYKSQRITQKKFGKGIIYPNDHPISYIFSIRIKSLDRLSINTKIPICVVRLIYHKVNIREIPAIDTVYSIEGNHDLRENYYSKRIMYDYAFLQEDSLDSFFCFEVESLTNEPFFIDYFEIMDITMDELLDFYNSEYPTELFKAKQ